MIGEYSIIEAGLVEVQPLFSQVIQVNCLTTCTLIITLYNRLKMIHDKASSSLINGLTFWLLVVWKHQKIVCFFIDTGHILANCKSSKIFSSSFSST